MPAKNGRDSQMLEEGNYFSKSKSQWPQPCNHHQPTLEELKSTTFSDYVRKVVLQQAEPKYQEHPSSSADSANASSTSKVVTDGRLPSAKDIINGPPTPYRNGMAKVTLPEGFMESGGIETTGRGPEWQEGTILGDMKLPSPIKQVVRGIGGIYEYTLLDLEPMSVLQFREIADEYLKSQVGTLAEGVSIELLQRKFWKRLGPTMQPALYGADMEGTLFKRSDYCCGWNISQLHSCLELLQYDQPDDHKGGIPGVTTPYLYFGMWASVFCAHTEDMNLLSINFLHAGAPKVWYAIAAGEDSQRFEQFCEGHYHHARTSCPEYMRHKRAMVSPAILKKAGIRFTTAVQYPGDAMITFPGGYHFGFNTGFNVAEATNFAVPEWIPYGRRANVCLCRPDSVRLDMNKFERLLLQYEKEAKSRRITWKDWAIKLNKKRNEEADEPQLGSPSNKSKGDHGQQPQRKPFWVEVMQPANGTRKKPKQGSESKKRPKKLEEIWHLAKPGGRKSLCPSARVLCIVPAVIEGKPVNGGFSSDDEEDEECFAGVVLEERDDHVRVRFDGMNKKEDMWIPIESPKIFLDGGRWSEENSRDLPKLHYWNIEDSKRRCV
jgi:jumonji domain-containing protein 2